MPLDANVLVVGGTGFVGRHVCLEFASRGYEVVVAGRHRPTYVSPHRFVQLDLNEMPTVLATKLASERPDIVVGAVGSIWGRSDDEMWSAAALPALHLLDAIELLARRPRLVHLGSVLEYGPMRRGSIAGAGTTPRPGSAYGRAKLAATQAVLAAARGGRLDAMVLRIANVVGPGTPAVSLLGRVAADLRHAASTGNTAIVNLRPLRAHRDYVDVRDVADAVVAAALAPVIGEVVGVGRGEAVPVRLLVDLLVEVSGVPARVVERGEPGPPPPGSAAEDWLRVDIRPAAELLDWRPRRSLQAAVHAMWQEVSGEPESPWAHHDESLQPGGTK